MALPLAALMFAGSAVANVLQQRSQLDQAKRAAAQEQKQLRQTMQDEIDAASARAYVRTRQLGKAVGAQRAGIASGGVGGGASARIAIEDTIGSFYTEAMWDKSATAETTRRLQDAIRVSQENVEIARQQATLNTVVGLFGSAVQMAPALQNSIDTMRANQRISGLTNTSTELVPQTGSLLAPNPVFRGEPGWNKVSNRYRLSPESSMLR